MPFSLQIRMFMKDKDALHDDVSQVMSISACCHWTESELGELKKQTKKKTLT